MSPRRCSSGWLDVWLDVCWPAALTCRAALPAATPIASVPDVFLMNLLREISISCCPRSFRTAPSQELVFELKLHSRLDNVLCIVLILKYAYQAITSG